MIVIMVIIFMMMMVMISMMTMITIIVLIIMINREDLRMKSKNLLYPAGMYKGMVWTAGKDILSDLVCPLDTV